MTKLKQFFYSTALLLTLIYVTQCSRVTRAVRNSQYLWLTTSWII